MNGEMINIMINIGCTLIGTIFGWLLNVLYKNRVKKVKLCYSLQPSTNIKDDVNFELRTKYSDSDYCIEVYNVGSTSILLERISLRYKNTIIIDCIITDENKAMKSCSHYIYRLNMQEYNAILRHCKTANLKKCKVISYDVSGKKIKGSMDLFLPYLQTCFKG